MIYNFKDLLEVLRMIIYILSIACHKNTPNQIYCSRFFEVFVKYVHIQVSIQNLLNELSLNNTFLFQNLISPNYITIKPHKHQLITLKNFASIKELNKCKKIIKKKRRNIYKYFI
jgi:hypothetical protein